MGRGMMKSILNKRVVLTGVMRAAWGCIYAGRDICALSEALEGSEAYTVRSNLAWKLRTLGENTEQWGERLEAYVDSRAASAGIDMQSVLAPLVAARAV